MRVQGFYMHVTRGIVIYVVKLSPGFFQGYCLYLKDYRLEFVQLNR